MHACLVYIGGTLAKIHKKNVCVTNSTNPRSVPMKAAVIPKANPEGGLEDEQATTCRVEGDALMCGGNPHLPRQRTRRS